MYFLDYNNDYMKQKKKVFSSVPTRSSLIIVLDLDENW